MKWIFVILGVILIEIVRLLISKKVALSVRSKQVLVGVVTIFSSILLPYLLDSLILIIILEGSTFLIAIYILYRLNLEKEQI